MSYSLDINFLKDKPDYSPGGERKKPEATGAKVDTTPIILGVAAALALVGGAFAGKLYFDQANQALVTATAGLDAELQQLEQAGAQATAIDAETTAIQEQTMALANVFDQLKPWSAILTDIRDRTPTGIRIDGINRVEIPPPPPDPNAPPPPPPDPNVPPPPPPGPKPGLEISGSARSFSDVNDFVLLLQRSEFLNAQDTVIVSANNQPNSVQVKAPEGSNLQVKLPDEVKFQVRTAFSEKPASEFLAELERKGAVGLVERIQTLKNKGVIQ